MSKFNTKLEFCDVFISALYSVSGVLSRKGSTSYREISYALLSGLQSLVPNLLHRSYMPLHVLWHAKAATREVTGDFLRDSVIPKNAKNSPAKQVGGTIIHFNCHEGGAAMYYEMQRARLGIKETADMHCIQLKCWSC